MERFHLLAEVLRKLYYSSWGLQSALPGGEGEKGAGQAGAEGTGTEKRAKVRSEVAGNGGPLARETGEDSPMSSKCFAEKIPGWKSKQEKPEDSM